MKYEFLTIEGNIGAGKTSLATKIAEQYNCKLLLEQFADNPFLPKFYENPQKHAFPLELSFLAERYQQLKDELSRRDLFQTNIVSDYYIYKSLIFAQANLEADEYRLFDKLFRIMYNLLPKPDLLVFLYLDIDNLQANIRKRGRSYEQNISDEYLLNVQKTYLDFIKTQQDQPTLIIDTNNVDFVHNPEDYEKLLNVINEPYSNGVHRIVL